MKNYLRFLPLVIFVLVLIGLGLAYPSGVVHGQTFPTPTPMYYDGLDLSDVSCPASPDLIEGYGTVTPSSFWGAMCSECLVVTPSPSAVPTWDGVGASPTPEPTQTVVPTQTAVPSSGAYINSRPDKQYMQKRSSSVNPYVDDYSTTAQWGANNSVTMIGSASGTWNIGSTGDNYNGVTYIFQNIDVRNSDGSCASSTAPVTVYRDINLQCDDCVFTANGSSSIVIFDSYEAVTCTGHDLAFYTYNNWSNSWSVSGHITVSVDAILPPATPTPDPVCDPLPFFESVNTDISLGCTVSASSSHVDLSGCPVESGDNISLEVNAGGESLGELCYIGSYPADWSLSGLDFSAGCLELDFPYMGVHYLQLDNSAASPYVEDGVFSLCADYQSGLCSSIIPADDFDLGFGFDVMKPVGAPNCGGGWDDIAIGETDIFPAVTICFQPADFGVLTLFTYEVELAPFALASIAGLAYAFLRTI